MAEDSDLERTESASARRIEQARERGNVPRSVELNTFVVLMAATLGLLFMGDSLLQCLRNLVVSGITLSARDLNEPAQMLSRLHQEVQSVMLTFVPLLAIVALVSTIASALMGGFLLTFEPLIPNFGKMNPMTGLGRMFSTQSLVNLSKAVLKAGLVGGVAMIVMWKHRDEMLNLISEAPEAGMSHLIAIIFNTLIWVVSSLLLLVAIDVPYQLFTYYKSLRMTKEEVRQEMKEAEGDPKVKQRIRQLQRQAAKRRMMQAVPKADVIVTNPTHYAVALQYDQATMRAPKVLAKGAFAIAEQIIARAEEHHIAILRTPPFARALYFHAEIDREIPVELFQAAAEVLAYVYQLRLFQHGGGLRPDLPEVLPVPAELDPGEKAENIEDEPDFNPEIVA